MAENTEDEILEEEEEEVEEEEAEEEIDEKPPVRSSSYYVGLRQGKKAAKEELEKKSSEEEELTDQASNAIDKKLSPVVSMLKKQADDMDLREHFNLHPEDRKIEKAIRRRMDAYPTVPVEDIAKILKYGSEQKERKSSKEETVERVRSKKLGGNSSRAEEPSLPSSQEDFKTIYARVKRGEKIDLTDYHKN